MRLVLLIVVAVVIVGGAGGSYYHYRCWRETRYDEMIAEVAAKHDVDPALVKALIKVQTNFGPGARTEDGSQGLLLVRPRVAEDYRVAHNRGPWGYICVHRRFRNHDPNKPEQYTSSDEGTCKAPGCGQPLINELRDPETNMEVACWFLGEAMRMLRDEVKPKDLVPTALIAYRYGLPERGKDSPSYKQLVFAEIVRREYIKYRPSFQRRARRAAGR